MDEFMIHNGMVFFGERQIMNARPNADGLGGPGCQVLFENGWTLSVQWHFGSYCERKNQGFFGEPVEDIPCITAEITAWDHEDYCYDGWMGGEVDGWVTVDRALELVDTFAAMPSGYNNVIAIYPKLRQIEA